MNRDIQLVQPVSSGALAYPSNEGWQQAGPIPGKPQGLLKLHRLLRGRYKWAIGLGLLFGALGGFAGFVSQKPGFKSEGLLMVHATVARPDAGSSETMPLYDAFVKSQVAILGSKDMIERAMSQPQWKSLGRPVSDEAVNQFYDNLVIDEVPGSEMLTVDYTDPDRKAAQAGVASLMQVYGNYVAQSDPMGLNLKLSIWNKRVAQLSDSLAERQQDLQTLSAKYNTDDLDPLLQEMQLELIQMRGRLDTAQAELADAEKQLGVAGDKNADAAATQKRTTAALALTPEEVAGFDHEMAELVNARDQDTLQIERLQAQGVLDQHPMMVSARNELTMINTRISARLAEVRTNYHPTQNLPIAGPGENAPITQADLDTKRDDIKHMQDSIANQVNLLTAMNQQREAIDGEKTQIASLQEDLTNANHECDQIQQTLLLNGQEGYVEFLSRGDLPVEPAVDKRKQWTAVGFIGGAIVPIGLLLMMGLLDSRYRYCDEAGTDMSGATLLGILPNLPDLMSDPEQAAIAAHCVHQIRTLLQISGVAQGRSVFAVTSAAAGDGKTSLTLALGLSFAASGSRTLLIDCDLIGAGLTARLNVHAEHGVLEAMAQGNLLDLIHDTDVNGLSILPVGERLGSYAGTVSPSAVRRLVAEARKHYDTILIDTGPVLGSIEAAPVAVAVDAVVLCVSRGQQRPIVDKAMLHLATIGCRLAGVVFNRANSQDFERSVSRMALPSIPATSNGNGKRREATGDGSAFGPVARAVASSVRPTEPSSRN